MAYAPQQRLRAAISCSPCACLPVDGRSRRSKYHFGARLKLCQAVKRSKQQQDDDDSIPHAAQFSRAFSKALKFDISTQTVAWLGWVMGAADARLLWKYHASARGVLLFVVRQQRTPPDCTRLHLTAPVGARLSRALGWAVSWEGEVASL